MALCRGPLSARPSPKHYYLICRDVKTMSQPYPDHVQTFTSTDTSRYIGTFNASLEMYSTQSSPAKATMEEIYLMNDALSRETNMSSPKKENIFHASWQDLEMYHTGENKGSEDCFSLDEDTIDRLDDMQYVVEETVNSVMYTIADIKPKIQKTKGRRTMDSGICKFSSKMRSIPESIEDTRRFGQGYHENRYSLYKNTFRPRLISESSIDSSDSYCIVFDAGPEVAYTSDLEESEESDIDQTSDDEDIYKEENVVSPVQKVKFNLNPEIHIMVQWDYAYRAARKGPWEEMARDRERFKGRINCIARVLNPILTVQHRTHIWQERFAPTE